MRLHTGMWVKTSYGTGPYIITHITRGCTCPDYLEEINCPADEEFKPSEPHIHLTVRKADNHSDFYLNGYNEKTLRSVWGDDYLIVIKSPFGQAILPF